MRGELPARRGLLGIGMSDARQRGAERRERQQDGADGAVLPSIAMKQASTASVHASIEIASSRPMEERSEVRTSCRTMASEWASDRAECDRPGEGFQAGNC